jgi:hypothetical protein
MAQFITTTPSKEEENMIIMMVQQKTYHSGLEAFLKRYMEVVDKKLNDLNNDHETDIMCKAMKKTIGFLQAMPYKILEKQEYDKRKKKEVKE